MNEAPTMHHHQAHDALSFHTPRACPVRPECKNDPGFDVFDVARKRGGPSDSANPGGLALAGEIADALCCSANC